MRRLRKNTTVGKLSRNLCGPELGRGANTPDNLSNIQCLGAYKRFKCFLRPAHWETLLRARAIETQSYVVAAAQVGRHNEKRASYGRSMVVDPWGKVLLCLKGVADAQGNAEDGAVEEVGFVDIDLDELERVRREMPLQRRT